jgi:UDP-glucose 4-epimerase
MNIHEAYSGRRCVITGGAGFVGSHLSDALLRLGATVTSIDIKNTPHTEADSGASYHVCDVRDYEEIRILLRDADVVFHLAALVSVPDSISHPYDYYDVNVRGTLNVLEAARMTPSKPRVVIASSAAVYGDQAVMPLQEDMKPYPQSPYGQNKYMNEEMAKLWHTLYGVQTVSMRPFNIYGTRMDPNGPYAGVVGKFNALHKEGKPLMITGDGTQTRDFVHVSDIVSLYLLLGVHDRVGAGEVVNGASGVATSLNELAQLFGSDITYTEARTEIKDSCASIEKASTLLSWKPTTTLKDGVTALKQHRV